MKRVVLRSPAESELAAAVDWYFARSRRAALRFIAAVDITLERIASAPEAFPQVEANIRRATVPRFPHGIYFTILPHSIAILAIHHARRYPGRWLR